MKKAIYFEPIPGNGQGYSDPRKQVVEKIFSWHTAYPEKSARWHRMCDCEVCLNRLWDDGIFRRIKDSEVKKFLKKRGMKP